MSVRHQKSSRRARSAPGAGMPGAAAIGRPEQAPTDERLSRIAVAAYFIAQRRGFVPGHELDDWVAAEAEIHGRELPMVMTGISINAKGKTS